MNDLRKVAAGLLALAPVLSFAEDKQPVEPRKPEQPGLQDGKAVGPKAQGPRIIIKTAKEKPPARVTLPKPGEYPATDILSLAGILTGRTVRLESERVRQTRVTLAEGAGGDDVSLAELTLILAAHRLFLFPVTDPVEGDVLVVSRNPEWKEEPPRFTKVLDVGEKAFKPAWEKVEKAVRERNGKLDKGETPIVALPDERTGKIILGASKEEHLTELSRNLEKEIPAQDPDRPHLYTYTGNYRPVDELEKSLRGKLSEADLNRLRIVIASRGNRLLFRGPAEVWEKARAALKELDKKD